MTGDHTGDEYSLEREVPQGEFNVATDAEHLRLLLESTMEGIYSIDRDGRCTFLNKAASRMLQLSPEQAMGRNMHALIHRHRADGSEFPVEECPILGVSQTACTVRAEDVFWRSDHTAFSVEYIASPILKDGQNIGTVVSFTDVTRRAHAEDAKRTSDARLQFALDATDIGAWDLDLVEGSAWRSLRHDQIFGYERLRPDWTYKKFLEHIHADDRDYVDRTFQGAVAQGLDWSFEARIIRADGEMRWIWARGAHHSIRKGKPTRMLGIVMDITERKQAEEALNNQRHWLEALLDLAPTPVLLVEPDSARVLFANRAANELAGGAFPKAAGKEEYEVLYQCSDADGNPIPTDAMPGVRLARGEHLEGFEMYWDTPAGTRALVVYADTLPAMHGHPATGILIFQDISEIKRMTEELRRVNRTKDEFLAIVSHELRTPLNAMLGWANILKLKSPERETYDRAVAAIERNAKAQAQIIEDILDTSRIISGQLRLERRPVDLGAIVQSAMDSVRPAADEKGLHTDVEVDAAVPTVCGDAGRLQQVIGNLLSNAIKFTPAGGRVSAHLRQDESQLYLQIRDTGQGITPDFLPQVFDRFQQEDSSSTRTQGGLGLGLAIAKHLLELHGGSISAASEGLGQGAVFTVTLPAVASSATPADSSPRQPSMPEGERSLSAEKTLSGLHVLAVDDIPDARHLIASVLEHYGARVSAAASAVEAMRLLRAERPDALVSDIEMPEQDGYVLIRQIRADPGADGGLPAIALTAHAGSAVRERVLQAGFDAHMPKPFDAAELVALIAQLTTRPAAT